MRPKSITQFGLVYGAAISLGLVSTGLTWDAVMAQVSVQRMVAQFGMGAVYVPAAIGLLIQLILWYFIVQRGSAIAKWVYVVLAGAGAAWSVLGLASGGAASTLGGIVNIVTIVLQVVGIWLLFRPDTPAWFGEKPADAE